MSELKPCPFCGYPAVISHEPSSESDDPTKYYRVSCQNVKCLMGYPDAFYTYRYELVSDWNTRFELTEEVSDE